MDIEGFRIWLENKNFTKSVVKDIVSRAKRANSILTWRDEETYLFYLEKEPLFSSLSMYVKSQLRRAIRLYSQYLEEK